jgi:ketosteroid isomerase-like protein
MSEENVEQVRQGLDAYHRRDLEELLSYMDSEIELHSAIIGGAEGNIYRGHDGFRRWYRETFETFEDFRNEWFEFRDLGDRVLAIGRVKARGRESGVELDSEMCWVFTLQRMKVQKAEGYLSRAAAFEAAGLPE